MRTARLPSVHASVAIRSQLEEGGIQVNTFEQVWRDSHQMSLVAGRE